MPAGWQGTGPGLASFAVATLLLAGCGGSNASGTPVTVVEKDFSIALSRSSFSPATYTFTIENKGQSPHDLVIKGPGVQTRASPIVESGQSGKLTVTLKTGSYELWCSVDRHKQKGMDRTIQVR
jgi:plastocyanin